MIFIIYNKSSIIFNSYNYNFIINQMPELINEKQILEGNNVVEYQLKNFSLKMNKAIKEDIKKLADLCGQSAFEGLLLDYQ